MGKKNKSDNPSTADQPKEKKQKKSKGPSEQQPASAEQPSSTFSLFGGQKSSNLDDIFSKGTSFTIPSSSTAPAATLPPIASSSKTGAQPDETVQGATISVAPVKKSRKQKRKARQEEEATSAPVVPHDDNEEEEGQANDNGESDEDIPLVHESLAGKGKKKEKHQTEKYVPEGESAIDRDRRTIFVGNLPLEVAKAKSALSQLRQHILKYAVGAKIESSRIRSVPFATPTVSLPSDDKDAVEEGKKRAKREKERIEAWRAQQDILEHGAARDKEEVDTAKTFIDTKGKRKVAFIKKDFHEEAGSCNAYIVFAYPHPDRPTNLPPILDPFEAVQKALAADGSSFLERTIRVDSVRLPSSEGLASASNNLARRDAWTAGADPKKSVFIGGLDYAAKDEDLRVFFEELIKGERGVKEDGGRWVENVRVIRDKDTQLGKGFAYVHFSDTESVDEILAIDMAKLRFAKKPLRVQRCKTLPSIQAQKAFVAPPKADKAAKSKPAFIPKGDPKLGDKLKDLSKEDRKAAKSSDADRLARRLAKKKLRGKMGKDAEKGAVKLVASKAEKQRGKSKVTAKKGRVRSSNALAKMKGSRS